MNTFRSIWNRIFPPVQPLPPGVYHYQAPADAPIPYRMHLRIEGDGSGILIINASTVVHLNPTAAEYAYHLIHDTSEEVAVNEIAHRYNVRKEIVRRDYNELVDRLKTMVQTPDLDPVTYLDFNREEPYTGAQSAPYRLDCALTYRLPGSGTTHGHLAPTDRVSRELTMEEWQSILSKAWEAGIPHAIFTGGEPTLRPDLHELIAHAEQLGMVTGLITGGTRLSEHKFLHDLLQSGLDHVMILLDPTEDQNWEAVRDTLAQDIAVTVHITLNRRQLGLFDETLDRLARMGVQNISLSADAADLKDELQAKRQAVAERQLRLVWDLPVPYSHYHPVALELAETRPEVDLVINGPGKAWLYVEPDGDVLPGQGYYQHVLGNFLMDPWDRIWQQAQQVAPGVAATHQQPGAE